MNAYKIKSLVNGIGTFNSIEIVGSNISIPCDSKNMDCRDFLIAWRDGATVTDEADALAPYSEAAVEALGLVPVSFEEVPAPVEEGP